MCKNDTGITLTKSEHHQSVITTIASNNKMLVNSLNKLNDKGKLINYSCIFNLLYPFFFDRS